MLEAGLERRSKVRFHERTEAEAVSAVQQDLHPASAVRFRPRGNRIPYMSARRGPHRADATPPWVEKQWAIDTVRSVPHIGQVSRPERTGASRSTTTPLATEFDMANGEAQERSRR